MYFSPYLLTIIYVSNRENGAILWKKTKNSGSFLKFLIASSLEVKKLTMCFLFGLNEVHVDTAGVKQHRSMKTLCFFQSAKAET